MIITSFVCFRGCNLLTANFTLLQSRYWVRALRFFSVGRACFAAFVFFPALGCWFGFITYCFHFFSWTNSSSSYPRLWWPRSANCLWLHQPCWLGPSPARPFRLSGFALPFYDTQLLREFLLSSPQVCAGSSSDYLGHPMGYLGKQMLSYSFSN